MKKLCFGILFLISVMILLIVLTGCQKTGQAYDIEKMGLAKPVGAYNVVNRVEFGDVGEVGLVKGVTHNWRWVGFNKSYKNPVVIAKPISFNGGEPGHARIKRVVDKGFAIRVEEWFDKDGWHTKEDVSFIVMEAGVHNINGKQIIAGKVDSYDNNQFMPVGFSSSFNMIPVVLAQTQTLNGFIPIVTRMKDVKQDMFAVRVQQEESKDYENYTAKLKSETIGFIAFEPGMYESSTNKFIAARTARQYTHNFKKIKFPFTSSVFIADMQTQYGPDTAGLRYRNLKNNSVEIKVEEEQSRDKETRHTSENVGYLLLTPLIEKRRVNGSERDLAEMIMGGEVNMADVQVRIINKTYNETYLNITYPVNNTNATIKVNSTNNTYSTVFGDANGDLRVTPADGLLAFKYYLGEASIAKPKLADVNCDGSVTPQDALTIFKYYLGEVDQFPCNFSADFELLEMRGGGDEGRFTFYNQDGKTVEVPFVLNETATYDGNSTILGRGTDVDEQLLIEGDTIDCGTSVEDCNGIKLFMVDSGEKAHILELSIDADNNEIDIDDFTYSRSYTEKDYTPGVISSINLSEGITIKLKVTNTSIETVDLQLDQPPRTKCGAVLTIDDNQVVIREESGRWIKLNLLEADEDDDILGINLDVQGEEGVDYTSEIIQDVGTIRTLHGTRIEWDADEENRLTKIYYPCNIKKNLTANKTFSGVWDDYLWNGTFSNVTWKGIFKNNSWRGNYTNSTWIGNFTNSTWRGNFTNSTWRGNFTNSSWRGNFSDNIWIGNYTNSTGWNKTLY